MFVVCYGDEDLSFPSSYTILSFIARCLIGRKRGLFYLKKIGTLTVVLPLLFDPKAVTL